MSQLDVSFASNEEEGKEGMALDRVQLIVIEIWWLYLS